MPQEFVKDPGAKLDYQIDWSAWLGSDTIQTSTWTVPAGLTKGDESKTSTTATVWVSGGTAGESYTLVNHIVTGAGREDDRSLAIRVRQR